MDARFRVRTRSDEELRPQTLEEFSDLVQRGIITRDDLVHDALTGEWAPAWAHPVYQLVTDPLVNIPSDGPPAATSQDGEAEEMVFVEARKQLRDEWLPRPEPESATAFRRRDVPTEQAGDVDVPEPVPARRSVRVPLMIPSRQGEGRRWKWERGLFVAAALLVILAISATVARSAFRWASELPVREAAEAEDTRSDRRVPMSEAAVRENAWRVFVGEVDGLRAELDVGEVPEIWLDGRYLADPAAYGDVRTFWHRYLKYVETVHAQEEDLYKAAYLDALDGAGVSGAMRSLRLATAIADFRARRTGRDTLYAKVWELAMAALSLDELLADMDGSVRWEPAQSERLSLDPVLEAASADSEAQLVMERALDRVMLALHGTTPGERSSREAVPGWLTEGLRRMGPA